MEKVLDAQAKGDTAGAIALQGAVKFNGGGHVNHSIFWSNLCPMKDYTPPEGELLAAIEAEFGSLDQFQAKFSATAAGVQGSGWGWLGALRLVQEMLEADGPDNDVLIAAGGVFTRLTASECADAGATVLMSPVLDEELTRWAVDEFGLDVDFAPGVATPSEVHRAHVAGASITKLFPCTCDCGWTPGGVVAVRRALPGIRCLASGGVSTPKQVRAFLDAGCESVVVGSLFDDEAVKNVDFERVRAKSASFFAELL